MNKKAIVLLTLTLALTGCKGEGKEVAEEDPLDKITVMQDVRKLKDDALKSSIKKEGEKDESKETDKSSGEDSETISNQGIDKENQEEVIANAESHESRSTQQNTQEKQAQSNVQSSAKEHKKYREYIEYIDFKVIEKEDSTLDQGKTYVQQDGKKGYRKMLNTQYFKGDQVIDEKTEVIYEEKPKDKIVYIGIKSKIEPYFDLDFARSAFNATNSKKKNYPDRNLSEFGDFIWDEGLYNAAKIRAKEQAQSFGHQRPNGSEWYTVHPDVMAENVAYGQRSPDSLVQAWLDSPTHAANIFSDYQYMAVATYVDENGVRYSAQLFK